MSKQEYSTKEKIIWHSSSISGVKKIEPVFEYGKTPNGVGNLYINSTVDKNDYFVVEELAGYTSQTKHVPSRKNPIFYGTLKGCKRFLTEIIMKCYHSTRGY